MTRAELWRCVVNRFQPRAVECEGDTGSLHMAAVLAYLGSASAPSPEGGALVLWLRQQIDDGHCLDEAGCGDPVAAQWIAATAMAWEHAIGLRDEATERACAQWLGAELALARRYSVGGVTCIPSAIPAPCALEAGRSAARDAILALCLSAPWPRRSKRSEWWDKPIAAGPRVLRDVIFAGPDGQRRRRLVVASGALTLRHPIKRAEIPGGYIAELPDEARKDFERSLSWVRHDARGPLLGFDWQQPEAA